MMSSVLDAIERWLGAPDVHEHSYSVLDLVDPMLEKAGRRTEARGHQFVFHPYFVDPDTTKDIRDRALAIVDRCLAAPSLKVVLRAASSLGKALSPPMGHFGRSADDDLRERWLSEQRAVVDRLRLLLDSQPEPLVAVAVCDAVSWHAQFGPNEELRNGARDLISGLPWSFELGMAKHMGSGHFSPQVKGEVDADWGEDPRDWRRGEADLATEREHLVDELVALHPEPSAGARWLEDRLAVIESAGEQAAAGDLLSRALRATSRVWCRGGPMRSGCSISAPGRVVECAHRRAPYC